MRNRGAARAVLGEANSRDVAEACAEACRRSVRTLERRRVAADPARQRCEGLQPALGREQPLVDLRALVIDDEGRHEQSQRGVESMVIEELRCRRWWWLRVTLGSHAEPIGQVHEAIDGLAFALLPVPTGKDLLALIDRVIRRVTCRLARDEADALARPTYSRGSSPRPRPPGVRRPPSTGCAAALTAATLEGARHRACRSGRRRSRWRRRCRHLPGGELAALGCSTPPAVDLEPYRRHQLGPGSLCACSRWQRYQTPSDALDGAYEDLAVHVGHHELAAFGGSTAPTGHHRRGDAAVTLTLRYGYA